MLLKTDYPGTYPELGRIGEWKSIAYRCMDELEKVTKTSVRYFNTSDSSTDDFVTRLSDRKFERSLCVK